METDEGAAGGRPPLTGTRVLDLSRLLPGAYATLLLADLGADVIKVEQPGVGDPTRATPPFTSGGDSGMHLALNRGKRSITVDLRNEAGRQVLLDLAVTADVLVESFRPGVMTRLGLGYPVLAEANPGLVYVALSGYGQDGPYAQQAGHDLNYQAYTGALSLNGHPDVGPVPPATQVADLGGAMMGVIATLAALRARDRDGRGQFCDVALADAATSMLALVAGAFAAGGTAPALGEWFLAGGLACYDTYRCADGGYVAVGALEPRFFVELCTRLGITDRADLQYDLSRQAELRACLAEVFARRTRDEWADELAEHDTCVAPVLNVAEALADPHARARGLVEDVAAPDSSTGSPSDESFTRLGVVPRLSGTPGEAGGHPSRLGADTEALLAELGRSPSDIARLRELGAV